MYPYPKVAQVVLYGLTMLSKWKHMRETQLGGFTPQKWGKPTTLIWWVYHFKVGFHYSRSEPTAMSFHPDNIDGPCGTPRGQRAKSFICVPILLKLSQGLRISKLLRYIESNFETCTPAPPQGPRTYPQGGHRAKSFSCAPILSRFSQGLHIAKLSTDYESNIEICTPAPPPSRDPVIPPGGPQG